MVKTNRKATESKKKNALPAPAAPETSRGQCAGALAKNLSSSVQKLRFMRIAENDQQQRELREQQKIELNNNSQWCVEGWQDIVQNELCRKSKPETGTLLIYTHARRSYGGVNKRVESQKIAHIVKKLSAHEFNSFLLAWLFCIKMGFLDVGTPLSWRDSDAVRAYVKQHGLLQLLHIWSTNRSRHDGFLRWGEEVEFSLVDINSEKFHSRVYAEAADILEELTVRDNIRPRHSTELSSDWHPEFASHMVEAIPSPPYPLNVNALLMIEPSMRLRRAKIQSILPTDKYVNSQTAFPRFGLDDFVSCLNPDMSSSEILSNEITRSVFIPDILVNPHPRFGTLVRNICSRRGANPFMMIPVFKDQFTGRIGGEVGREADWSRARDRSELSRFEVEKLALKTINPVKDHIYMDCFGFGMGMSCVQTTFACPDISSARFLYDQLSVLAPLFLALTASTPFQRGLLSDHDTRWSTLEQAVDCRTTEEMMSIPKSRYSGVSKYISDRSPLADHFEEYNDTNAPVNLEAKQILMARGMDEVLADHFAHLWIRDPMVIFAEKVELDDTRAVDHFENIQSTNWNSVRFKPPPPAEDGGRGPVGWRVEFRTPDIQLTDFDNAAGVALISVLAQAIAANDLDFYIPMSLNDVNMERSWWRNAINNQKFHCRRNVTKGTLDRMIVELSLFEILAGGKGFPGIIPICEEFMRTSGKACGSQATEQFAQYCDILKDRAAGRKLTSAQFLRKFVMQHPAYEHDSVINPTVSHDLTVLSTNIGFGVWVATDLHGNGGDALIYQTPLPSSTRLPVLSVGGEKTLEFVDAGADVGSIELSSKMTIIKKMNVSNNIENIYTIPVGVTTQFDATPNTEHLFDRASTEILRPKEVDVATASVLSASPLSASLDGRNTSTAGSTSPTSGLRLHTKCLGVHAQVSSEDFTRSWIFKGFDYASASKARDSVAKRRFLLQLLTKKLCTDGTVSPPTVYASNKATSSTTEEVNLEGLSTVCPSSSLSCECDVGDELIDELSRNFILGFDTEEDLEYFKQVGGGTVEVAIRLG